MIKTKGKMKEKYFIQCEILHALEFMKLQNQDCIIAKKI